MSYRKCANVLRVAASFEVTSDLRYLNAALKMNEMLKQSIPVKGRSGLRRRCRGDRIRFGRVPADAIHQLGSKFLADALMLELRLMPTVETKFEDAECA